MWRRHEPLSTWTTFHLGGPAEWFAEPTTEEECLAVWHQARKLGKRIYVLGGGSNILVADAGVPGAVISTRRLRPRALERVGRRARVSAGVPLARLVKWAADEGLGGLEHLAGIPGLVGGAIAMNAGGHTGCIGERVLALEVLEPTGRMSRLCGSDVRWAYRTANLRGRIALNAEFGLKRRAPAQVRRRTQDALEAKRASQPLGAWSAGCVFRNPPGQTAGRLIEQAGLKKSRRGDAEISARHANFIVNRGRATSVDVMRLIDRARTVVRDRWERDLSLEIQYWPYQVREAEEWTA